MHDFLLAKEIIDALKKIAQEKNIQNAKSVSLEIGNISMAHDNHEKHEEYINLQNLEFGLRNIAKNTVFENTKFNLKKSGENSWKIIDMEV